MKPKKLFSFAVIFCLSFSSCGDRSNSDTARLKTELEYEQSRTKAAQKNTQEVLNALNAQLAKQKEEAQNTQNEFEEVIERLQQNNRRQIQSLTHKQVFMERAEIGTQTETERQIQPQQEEEPERKLREEINKIILEVDAYVAISEKIVSLVKTFVRITMVVSLNNDHPTTVSRDEVFESIKESNRVIQDLSDKTTSHPDNLSSLDDLVRFRDLITNNTQSIFKELKNILTQLNNFCNVFESYEDEIKKKITGESER